MRFAIDARAAAEVPAGRGRYVRELLRAWSAGDDDHEFELLAREPWQEPLDERFRWRLFPGGEPLWAATVGPRIGRVDATLATNSYLLAGTAPRPVVVTVFDLAVFDDARFVPSGSLAERLTLPVAVGRADGFACISQSTRDLLVARHPTVAARAVVTPLGVARDLVARDLAIVDPDHDVAAAHGVSGGYVLALGTREPRKNLARTVDAFVALPPAVRGDRVLAIVGQAGWGQAEVEAAMARAGDLVRVLGYVPDEDLPSLYAGADLFVYPSLHEGFGLPVLEAMACGAPVLTSDRSSLPEVAGDAAVLVDPTSTTAIADGMARVLGDAALGARLRDLGLRRAGRFGWATTAQLTLGLLRRVASGRGA